MTQNYRLTIDNGDGTTAVAFVQANSEAEAKSKFTADGEKRVVDSRQDGAYIPSG